MTSAIPKMKAAPITTKSNLQIKEEKTCSIFLEFQWVMSSLYVSVVPLHIITIVHFSSLQKILTVTNTGTSQTYMWVLLSPFQKYRSNDYQSSWNHVQ